MASQTTARATSSKDLGVIRRYEMATSTTLYAGCAVAINSAGLAVAPASTLASSQGCVGVAVETKTSGTGGSEFIKVQEGTFLFTATSIADTDVANVVYFTFNNEFDETQTSSSPRGGFLVEVVSSTSGWVAMGLGLHQ